MNEIDFDINELHEVQYRILVEFDKVCKRHNLKYFLGFGSMLGAVRHKGFIPWDDDIDVLMMYSEFEKLKAIDPEEWGDRFFLQSSETDAEFNRCAVKIRDSYTTLIGKAFVDKDINQGVNIDIEPLISLADNPRKRKKQYFDTQMFMLLRVGVPPANHGILLQWIGKIILMVIPNILKDKLRNYYLKKILAYEGENTEYLYVVNGNVEMMRDLHKRAIFTDTTMMRFEGGLFPIPGGYEEWLTTRYGDYQQLPPKEEQGIKLDRFVKVDLHTPYKKYKGKYYCCDC